MDTFGNEVEQIINQNIIHRSLLQDPHLNQLTKLQMVKLSKKLTIRTVEEDEVLIKAGDPCKKLYILLQGTIVNVTT